MKYTKIYLFLIIILLSVSCGFTFIPESDFDVDNTSPYVTSVVWDANYLFDISRKTNSSFDEILKTTNESKKNYNVSVKSKLMVTFSENMYVDSLFQYGVSETAVVIEGEPSRSFLNGMKSPPLSDYNVAKILKVKVEMLSETSKNQLILDFSDAEECITEDDFKTKFCQLKKDTNYTLVVSMGVLNENGRELVVKTDNDKFMEDNFVMLFRTTGTPPTVISTQPSNFETDICLNLQEVIVNFSAEMDQPTITTDSFTVSTGNVDVSGAVLTTEAKSATLTLASDLTPGTYKINLDSTIRSKSRVNIEPISFTFTTAATASTDGPEFVQNPTTIVVGNSILVNWETNVKSLADVKYGKGTANTEYVYNNYSTLHSITLDASEGSGDYVISITPRDRCGNISLPETTTATILNHPLISEVSPNPASSSDEFIEIYNDGDTDINLAEYTVMVGTDVVYLPNQNLSSKGYLVIADTTHTLNINESAVIVLEDLDLTKTEPVYLKKNAIDVDSYTYAFKATGDDNKSAQRIDVTLRDSDATNYCESSPTPGSINACQ